MRDIISLVAGIGITLMVGIYSIISYGRDAWLDQHGQTAAAQVVAKDHDYGGRQFSGPAKLIVVYYDAQSIPHRTSVNVTNDYYADVVSGQTIAITYDPANPTNTRLADTKYADSLWRYALLVYGGVVVVIAAAYVFVTWWQRRRPARR